MRQEIIADKENEQHPVVNGAFEVVMEGGVGGYLIRFLDIRARWRRRGI